MVLFIGILIAQRSVYMRFGYARVSTERQDLDRQLAALAASGVEEKNIFSEKASGTVAKRPQLEKMKAKLREGDEVVVESFSRLGRSTSDLLALMRWFESEGVSVVSLKESFDTSTPTGKLMVTMMAAMAEFERDITVERVREGLRCARAKGKKGGRPRKDPKLVDEAVRLYKGGAHSLREIAALTTVKAPTLYKALKERDSVKLS